MPSAEGSTLRETLQTLVHQGVEFLSVADLIDRARRGVTSNRPSVTFTVDDGYQDFGVIAAPIFEEFRCPVTVFLSTNTVTTRAWYWWDRLEYAIHRSPLNSLSLRIGDRVHRFDLNGTAARAHSLDSITELVKFAADAERRAVTSEIGALAEVDIPDAPPDHYRTLTWDEVRGLESEIVSFGPHSCSHPIFSRIDDETAHREIFDSWAVMRRECRFPVPVFCYPNGTAASFSERDMRLVREAGLIGAVAYVRGRIHTGRTATEDLFRLPRYEMPADSFDAAWLSAAVRERPGA